MGEIKPIAWFTEDHLTDRSATTYDIYTVERWINNGWPVTALVLHSDHEAEVARLRAEVEKVRGYEVAPLEAKVAELRTEIEENEKAINVWRGRTQRAEADAAALRVDAERYREAIGIVCEGFTLPNDVRKILEKAMWSDAAMGEGK